MIMESFLAEDTQYKKYYDETLQWVDDLYYNVVSITLIVTESAVVG